MVHGAGDGNRTHTTSLEGWDSTIELHPHTECVCLNRRVILYHQKKRLSTPFYKKIRNSKITISDLKN